MGNTSNEYYDIVGEYWNRYIDGTEEIPRDLDMIHPEILDSWKRSLKYGVSPFGVRNTTLPPDKLDALLEKNRLLISVAHDHLKKLYLYVKGTNFELALVDHDGYVLDILADDDLIHQKASSSGPTLGCLRSEKAVGTSGIAICLTLGTPYAVYGKEHFIQPHHDYICRGAPVYSQERELLGCLALIGPYRLAPAHSSSVMLVDRSGQITQANKSTRSILGLKKEPINTSIYDLFTDPAVATDILRSGKDISNKEVFVNNSSGASQTVIMSVIYSSVYSADIVIKFDRVKSIYKLVNKIGGFTAKYTFDCIISSSPCMESAKSLGRLAAKNDTNLLILGESGVGKDVPAQAVHNASHRADGHFIAINCAALPKRTLYRKIQKYNIELESFRQW